MAYIFGSIWDRFNRNALNDLSKSVEYQGIAIQDLVAKGQLTPTQYANLIETVNGLIAKGEVSVYDIDTNLGKIGLSHLSDDVKAMMTGDAPVLSEVAPLSVNNVHISNKSVTADKTDFITTGKNLFDSSRLLSDQVLTSDGSTTSNFNMYTTDYYIAVTPETDFYKSHEGQIVFYDRNLSSVLFGGQATQGKITSPADSYYAKVSVKHRDLPAFQFERGSVSTDYEPFKREIDRRIVKVGKGQIDKGAVELRNVDGFTTGKNLINKAEYIHNHYVNRGNGELVPNIDNTTTGIMDLDPGKTYNFSPRPSIGAVNGAYLNEQGDFVSGLQFTSSSSNIHLSLPAGATSVQMSFENGIADRAQLEEGTEATPYEPYYYYHPGIVAPAQAGNTAETGAFLEVTSPNDVRFLMPLSADRYKSFRFSNANTSDDLLKKRESAIFSGSGATVNKLYNLMDDASNKEFAIRVSNGTESEWFPEHNGIPTVFKGNTGFVKLLADGNEIDLTKSSNAISFKKAKLIQKLECQLPSDSAPRAIITFIADISDGQCKETVRIEWKQGSTIPVGYIFMVPMNTTEFVDNLLTNKFEYIHSKPDTTEQLLTEINDLSADEFYFTSNRSGKTDVVLKSEIHTSSTDLLRNWWQHRRGVNEKLYPTFYDNTERVAGDVDYFEGSYSIEAVAEANEVYKLN